MAYYTGSAANVAAVLTALTNACVDEGWTWSGGILSKDDPGIFVRLDAATEISGHTPLCMWGRSAIDSGETPAHVSMCVPILSIPPSYPVTYHAFVFDAEVFFIVNYSDKYQWLAFGQSDQPGLGSTGNWVCAINGHAKSGSASYYPVYGSTLNLNGGNLGESYYSDRSSVIPAMFWADLASQDIFYRGNNSGANWFFDAGLESDDTYHPWMEPRDGASQKYLCELLATQPNNFNNEGILIPIKLFMIRGSSKFSQVLQVQNARHIRIDNYTPTEIIQLGTDQWMVFPWYRKNSAARDGGQNVDHSGTFGWAIKYEPPA